MTLPRSIRRLQTIPALAVAVGIALCAGPSVSEAKDNGKQLYATQCASCHGDQGQGVSDAYKERLIGDWSVAELTEFVTRRMPEGEANQCVGSDARAVSEWMFEAFYSPAARARNHPPRVELARLTADQYRNTIADAIREFTGANGPDEQRGLVAEYYNSRNFDPNKKVITRTDPNVDYQFGENSPGDKIGKEEFSAQWIGGLIAPDSGDYEFTVNTDNGIKLWINDSQTAAIDGWVSQGAGTQHRVTVRLIGGRMYYLKVHFFKFKEKTAQVQLKWKRPNHVEQIIPQRFLSPKVGGDYLIVKTDFPPEDLSYGYTRATSISRAWHAATTNAAIEVSERIADNLKQLAKYRSDRNDSDSKLRKFVEKFAELVLRRKLTNEQKAFFIERPFKDAPDPVAAVRRVVLLVLKSPSFLYREIQPGHDDFDVAARMSYTLWDSIPDRQLRDVAARKALNNPHQLRFQAERMIRDPRTRVKLRQFLHHWLRMDHVTDPSKDEKLFPGYNQVLLSDLRNSLDMSLDDIVWSEQSDFRKLLLDDHTWMNERLAKFYGAKLQNGAGNSSGDFTRTSYQPKQRAGVLSHPFLMTGFAYHDSTSPIHRGVFMARNLLGRMLRPPPDAVSPLPPDVHADMTTRQRIDLQTAPDICNTCHRMINPLGFTLENFDAVGRLRKQEKNKPIDTRGMYRSRTDETVEFNGARELAQFLAKSPEVHQAFVKQLFHHSVQQPILAFGTQTPERLTQQFAKDDFNIQKLLVAIATRAAVVSD